MTHIRKLLGILIVFTSLPFAFNKCADGSAMNNDGYRDNDSAAQNLMFGGVAIFLLAAAAGMFVAYFPITEKEKAAAKAAEKKNESARKKACTHRECIANRYKKLFRKIARHENDLVIGTQSEDRYTTILTSQINGERPFLEVRIEDSTVWNNGLDGTWAYSNRSDDEMLQALYEAETIVRNNLREHKHSTRATELVLLVKQ